MKKEKKYVELYKRLRHEIKSGSLPPGSRLPSKREQALRSGVSVITVEGAYRQLLEEGYVYSKERSGYYVAQVGGLGPAREQGLLHFLPEEPRRGDPYFPYSLWAKTMRYVMSEYSGVLTSRSPDKGCALLRNALASYMQRCRGMYAQPEQIVIGSGSEQLYSYVVRLLGSEKVYAIEDPSYEKIEAMYVNAGAEVEKLPLASDGISSEALAGSGADVLHVTPFHSWPSGISAPAAKRYEYLRVDGYTNGQWVLVDCNDVVVNVFQKETRELYKLESLWKVPASKEELQAMASATESKEGRQQ